MTACKVPPPGWTCRRNAGHEGPCAAVPADLAESGYHTAPHSPCSVCAYPGCGGEHVLTNYEVKLRADLVRVTAEQDAALLEQRKTQELCDGLMVAEMRRTDERDAARKERDEAREAAGKEFLESGARCAHCRERQEEYERYLCEQGAALEEARAAGRKAALRDAAEMVVRDAEVIFQGDRYELRDAILALGACAETPNASTNVE